MITRFSYSLIVVLLLLLGSCDQASVEDTPEGKSYAASLALDEGNYQQTLDILGNCSDFSGDAYYDCLLDVAAAYLGLAGMDLLTIAQEVLQIHIDGPKQGVSESKQITQLIVAKITHEAVAKANDHLATILSQLESSYIDNINRPAGVCTLDLFDNLQLQSQEACLMANPLLLQQKITGSDNNSSANSGSVAVSLQDITDFSNILTEANPTLDNKALSRILSNQQPLDINDLNNNDAHDALDAQGCLIEQYVASVTPTSCTDAGRVLLSMEQKSSNAFASSNNSDVAGLHSVVVVISDDNGMPTSSTLYYLVEVGDSTSVVSTEGYANAQLQSTQQCNQQQHVNGIDCFPKPILQGDGSVKNSNDNIAETFNDEAKFKAIANLTFNDEDDLSEQEKQQRLQRDICDFTGEPSKTNRGNCEWDDTTGKLIYPQTQIIDYWQSQGK